MKRKAPNSKGLAAAHATPGPESTPSQRVRWLLDRVWEGNRSEMARAVGCSHSVLTKIAAEQQDPGRRLLTAIASHPKVNPGWLLSGQGEPLLAERPDAPPEGWPIPIAKQVLPGPPDLHRDLLSGEHFPVAGGFYRPTRYWLEIQRGDLVAKSDEVRIDAGDLLLMETDENWRRQIPMVDERLCVVRLDFKGKREDRLGLVSYYPGDESELPYLSVDYFESERDRSKLVREYVVREYPGGKIETFRRVLRQVEGQGPTLTRVSNLQLGPITHNLDLGDISAVCLLAVRRQ